MFLDPAGELLPYYEGPDADWLKFKVVSWEGGQGSSQIGDDHPVKKLNELYTGLVYSCDDKDNTFA